MSLVFQRLMGAALSACILASSSSESVADDRFAGKTIRIIVGAGAASGYALYSQIVAQHLGRFLPGKPNVISSFMPGASGLTAMNHLFEAAPRDGLTIGVAMQDMPIQQTLSAKGVRYDARSFGYISRATSNVPVHFVWRTSKVRDFEGARLHEVTTGASSATGAQAYLPKASNSLLGTKWKIIAGYGDLRERQLAMERGEVDAGIASASLFRDQLREALARGNIIPIVQYAPRRHQSVNDTPTILEIARDEASRRVFEFLVADLGRSFIAPPGLPADVLSTIQTAFASMISDPAFLAEAEKRGADIDFLHGRDLAAYVGNILNTPPDVIAKARQLMEGG